MCSLFGLLDYKGFLSSAQRLRIIRALGQAAEARGTDATGIAFLTKDGLRIQKAPRPAHEMQYHIPPEAAYIMGHTRMTTQGSEKKNQNNHPFPGKAGNLPFALAHNGVLYNDRELRRTRRLPSTTVETDSYVAVQLLEQQRELSFRSLKGMAEALRGSFTITVLDRSSSLYIVKGNNPLTIWHFPEMGFYLYASTTEILTRAWTALGLVGGVRTIVPITQGEILNIDAAGKRTTGHFDDSALRSIDFRLTPYWSSPVGSMHSRMADNSYLDEVIQYGLYRGVPEWELQTLMDAGYDALDIEELLFDPELRRFCLDEIAADNLHTSA